MSSALRNKKISDENFKASEDKIKYCMYGLIKLSGEKLSFCNLCKLTV